MKKLSLTSKLLVSLAAVTAAASVAGLGTFAAFTSSTSASASVGSGTVVVALGATGAATNRLTVNAAGIVPGDTIQRSVDLLNSGSADFGSLTLSTSANPSSLLDTDGSNGLQMAIDRCSTAWTEAGAAPAYTYTCGGTTTSVLASRQVIGAGVALSNLASLTAGSSDKLRVTLSLPATAGNTFQNLTSVITYTFTATQRAGTNK